PLQFGPAEDLARYPRDVERDARLAAERGVDLLFAPTDAEMYLAGEPIVRVSPGPLGDRLCGAFRPGHFVGVLTVVAKLFNIVQPDVAVFGQKDYQQAVLIRRMAVDLDMPIEIVVAPLVREPDGLAMSSRNAYLTGDARPVPLRGAHGRGQRVPERRAERRPARRAGARGDRGRRRPDAVRRAGGAGHARAPRGRRPGQRPGGRRLCRRHTSDRQHRPD